MPYKAIDIAKYIIRYYKKKYGMRINSAKLQKILFYIQKECLQSPMSPGVCFEDYICAQKLGPIVLSVYYEYAAYLAGPILTNKGPSIKIKNKYREIIDRVLERYKTFRPEDMIYLTQHETCWMRCYKEGETNYIPVEYIRASEIVSQDDWEKLQLGEIKS